MTALVLAVLTVATAIDSQHRPEAEDYVPTAMFLATMIALVFQW